jgi:hypothetical protein
VSLQGLAQLDAKSAHHVLTATSTRQAMFWVRPKPASYIATRSNPTPAILLLLVHVPSALRNTCSTCVAMMCIHLH